MKLEPRNERPSHSSDERPRKTPTWKPHWKWIAGAAALVVLGLILMHHNKGDGATASAGKKGKGGGAAIPVAVAAATRGDMPVYLDGLGSVAAYYTVNVHSRVDGQLMAVLAREGQLVKEGETLAQIDPRPFQAQLEFATGALTKDQALLTNAKLDLDRYKALVADRAIPRQQYDTQVAQVAQDEGAVKADQAAVDSAKLNLAYAQITSPITGRIGLRQVDPGNIVHASDANGMFVITQLQPISVLFTLPEDSLPDVLRKLHSGARLRVEAYNRDRSKKLAVGSLVTVDNQIDPNSGTAKLKAVFDNKDEALFPNQFVNVRLLLETRKSQIIVPSVALQRGAQGQFLYVAKQDGTADLRQLKVGVVEGDSAAIDSGVQPGEDVVVDGAEKLQPGSKLQVSIASGRPAAKAASGDNGPAAP